MLKKTTAWCVLIYGAILALLGFVGYLKSGSLASLYMGTGFGVLLALSSIGMFRKLLWCGYSALILTLILVAVFTFRYSATGKPVPAILAVLSGGMLLYLLAQMGKWRRAQ